MLLVQSTVFSVYIADNDIFQQKKFQDIYYDLFLKTFCISIIDTYDWVKLIVQSE